MFWTIISTFIAINLIWWVVADRRLRPTRWARLWRALLGLVMGGMVAYMLLTMIWSTPVRRSGTLPVPVHSFIYLWQFFVLPILTVILFVKGVKRVGQVMFGKRTTTFDASPPVFIAPPTLSSALTPIHPRPTRRQILTAAAFAAPPVLTAIASGWTTQRMYDRRLRRFTITIPQLPRQLDGMTIAHVSDTHIGKFLNPDRLPGIAEDINNLNADFVAFTGDLIDLAMDDLPYGIHFLRSLKSRCGLVVCEGNHDIMENRGDFEYAMRDAELPIILGEQKTINYLSPAGRSFPVQFLAVPWNMTDPEMVDAVNLLKPELNPAAFPILLGHHPHSFDAAAAAGFPLVLSGHTHGGQIMVNSQFGIGSLRFRYTSGLYQKAGSSLIVNNGIGNWFPLRINAPAELVHITLRSV